MNTDKNLEFYDNPFKGKNILGMTKDHVNKPLKVQYKELK